MALIPEQLVSDSSNKSFTVIIIIGLDVQQW